MRHRGGGAPNFYRLIDFKRAIFDLPAVVLNILLDPNRSSFIALILYKNGFLSYINAPSALKKGDFIITSKYASISAGNTLPLLDIPVGTIINNIELNFGLGSQLCRAAGTFGTLLARKIGGFSIIRLKSKEEYIIFSKNLASIGIVSNSDFHLKNLRKAGTSRHLGIRPHVRGVAMNPVDHPHGGGEGKTSGGRPSVSPWGKLTKGLPTRKKKKIINIYINLVNYKIKKCFLENKKIIYFVMSSLSLKKIN